MSARSSDCSRSLARALDLHPLEETLHILFDPATHAAWGWGYTATAARQLARARMQAVDSTVHPCPGDESVADHLDRCEDMQLIVPRRHVLDLLALLELLDDSPERP
ncbi:MAG: hypothetical protein H6741_32535 [Alphaproteobacteria bacterium]|nr:hypothetical protein [Alphaproteobacteria bacterium]